MTGQDPAPRPVTAVFVAFADPSRRQVVAVIARAGESTSTAIANELEISRQAVAKHLAKLIDAQLVESERRGRETWYRLRPGPLQLAAHWLQTAAGAWDRQLDIAARAIEEE